MRRIERLINLIAALLDTERPLTAAEIRERINGYDPQQSHAAFRRAFERDKEHLRAMGIPLETVSTGPDPDEQADGYIIPKDRYYLPELDLDPDELTALRLAGEILASGNGTGDVGWLKLSIEAGDGPTTGPRVRWGADIGAEHPHLAPLYGAFMDRAPVRFDYKPASGQAEERTLEIYSLVHRRGSWYALGRDASRDAIRAFKLSRIVGTVDRGGGSYTIPEGFTAADHLQGEAYEIGGREEPSEAVVQLDPKMKWWIEQNMPGAVSEAASDGWFEVRLPLTNVDALVSWVLGFGPEARIVSPPEARSALLDHLAPYLGGRA